MATWAQMLLNAADDSLDIINTGVQNYVGQYVDSKFPERSQPVNTATSMQDTAVAEQEAAENTGSNKKLIALAVGGVAALGTLYFLLKK